MAVGNDKSPIAVAMYDNTGVQLTQFPVSGTVSIGNSVSVAGTVSVGNAVSVSGTVATSNQYYQTTGYTQITTNGTTTVKSGTGVFFGINPIGLGTTATVAAFDGATQIMGLSPLAGINSLINPAPQGVGVRFGTSLLVVTAGVAAPTVNALWD